MKKLIAAFLVLCAASLLLADDLEFKYDKPRVLVSSRKSPNEPSIAWTGSTFALVYDDYHWTRSKSKVYLMFVNSEGKVTRKPRKISTGKLALEPRIVWTGKEFGVLYAAGSSSDGVMDAVFYLERYNTSGKRLSRHQLTGNLESDYDADYSFLLWTGKSFGMFYYADPVGSDRPYTLFCRADENGVPQGDCINIGVYLGVNSDVSWDGKRYVLANAGISYDTSPSSFDFHLAIVSESGKLLGDKQFNDFDNGSWLTGVQLVHLKKKKFLIYIGASSTFKSPPPTTYRDDIYVSKLKVKNKGFGSVKFSNSTQNLESGWKMPRIVTAGNKYYLGCGHGCGLMVSELDAEGGIVGAPLFYESGGT